MTVTDDTGVTLSFSRPTTRIVPLYGAYGELLLALGLGDALIARTAADVDSAALADLPSVGTHMRPNAELIAALEPDLILQLSGRKEAQIQTEALRNLGLPVLTFSMDSFEDIFAVLKILGRLTGREEAAATLVSEQRQRLSVLAARHVGKKPVRVFFESRYPNLLAAGARGIVQDIITAAGGENVISEEKKLVRCNEETLFAADPDVYILQQGPMNPTPTDPTTRAHYKALRAVASGRVLMVDEVFFARPGPRAVEAAEVLADFLYP